ncbi:GMP reductase [Aphelenchoides fujianensis]|nr:GMP reductase [Aphelenchoides fujianensis]
MPRIDTEIKLDFKDVLLRPKRSTLRSREDVDLTREFTFRNSKKTYTGIPIVASNMDTVGTFEMAIDLAKHNCFTTVHKHYTVEEWGDFAKQFKDDSSIFNNIAISSGSSGKDFDKLKSVIDLIPNLSYICLDAGVGYPQLSAVLECADAAHGLNGHVMSDGGCTNPGDVAKAVGAGADFRPRPVGGEIIEKNGKKFKLFYGMSSDTAMKKHHGSVAEYRASEGKTIEIPYRGDVNDTIKDMLGGLRSACTYTGASKLKELAKRATFIRVSAQTNDMYNKHEV